MNIYIDIDRLICCDKVQAYNANVHWQMDDADIIDQKDMDELKRRIQYEVDRTLENAHSWKAKKRTEY